MTHEEAARILDPDTTREALNPYADSPVERMRALDEACRIAAEVLRNRKTGEALTLEQLREMDGQPVWVGRNEAPHDGKWFIVDHADVENPDKTLYTKEGVTYSDYGTYFTAYAYPPAHIDREEWTAEWVSNGNRFVCSRCGVRCAKESDETDYYPLLSAFCPSCGRAMTPDAWAELEKKMGVR